MLQKNCLVPLTVRRYRWQFDDVNDRDWFAGSPALSRWFDVYTLLVPDNEAFYIRTLSPCLKILDSEIDKAVLLNFFRQESLHGVAHRAYWKRMRDMDIRFDGFLKFVNWILYSVFEPIQPHRLRVATVAAIEHINASLGHIVLKRDLMSSATRELKEIFYWHFAEEIEHKAVAHKVLIQCYPGYVTRILGALVAFPSFYFLSFLGMSYLLAKERRLFKRDTARDLFQFWIRDGVLSETFFHLKRYFNKSFDPWDLKDFDLVGDALIERRTLHDQHRGSIRLDSISGAR